MAMNARQRRESASIQAAGGSIEIYPFWSRVRPALLRLVGLGRRRAAAPVVYLPDRRSR
jgi:hypothetical protein